MAVTSGTGTDAPELVAGRILGAGLVGWMAWIHLHLWSGGYLAATAGRAARYLRLPSRPRG